jgi:hypothetical protein
MLHMAQWMLPGAVLVLTVKLRVVKGKGKKVRLADGRGGGGGMSRGV